MGIIEDTAVKAKDAFDVVAKKTGEVWSIQKLKYNIACINSQLSKDFETLGRLYFEQLTAEKAETAENTENASAAEENAENAQTDVNNDSIQELKAAIIDKKEKIKEMEDMLDSQKKVLVCPVCSTKNPAESSFCSKCGTKLS